MLRTTFRPELRINDTKTIVTGETTLSNQIIEARNESYSIGKSGFQKVLAMARNNYQHDVDVSWLPAAAQTYDISPKIEDYLIVDVAAVTVDVPNRNLQCFPYEEITYFDYAYGMMVYRTFVGMPSCKDHANEVDANSDLAKGVIFDACLQYVPEFDIYKIRLLQGFDRTKDARLVAEIESGKRKWYSMGSLVSNFVDPISGEIESRSGQPKYPKGSTYMGRLSYSLCAGVKFIENSSVEEPADPFAEGQTF